MDAEERLPEKLEDPLARIEQKCEQYWNEPIPALEDPEWHAILEFIHACVSEERAAIRAALAEAFQRGQMDGESR